METEWKFPPCFSREADYALWRDGSYQENLAAQHCTDCLPSFKMRMAKAGRCMHPETVFAFTPSHFDGEDGVEISGHWQREPRPKVVRFVKPAGRPRKPNSKLLAMGINIAPVGVVSKEERDRQYWAEQQRRMRERMSFGR